MVNKFFFIYFSKMPTYSKNQKQFYSTRSEVLQKFREEEKKNVFVKKKNGRIMFIKLHALIA